MKTTLILLAGRKGVGKSTAADFLTERLFERTNRAVRKSFARKLKEIAALIGIPIQYSTGSFEDKSRPTQFKWEEMSQHLKSRYPDKSGVMSVRDVLQVFGSDVIRDCFCEEVWVKSLMAEMQGEISHYKTSPGWEFLTNLYYIVDDCRMKNEVINFDGFDRTIKIKIVRPSMGSADTHKSETELESVPDFRWDYIINNDGTLEQYIAKVSKILGDIQQE